MEDTKRFISQRILKSRRLLGGIKKILDETRNEKQ